MMIDLIIAVAFFFLASTILHPIKTKCHIFSEYLSILLNTTIIKHNVPSGSFMSTIIVKAIAIAGKRMITIVINFILS